MPAKRASERFTASSERLRSVMSRRRTVRTFSPPTSTTKFLGRGLGLAAVQGIVRQHSGVLTVESRPGQGTTFKLLLPVLPSAAEPARAPSLVRADVTGTETILVVDDEETVRFTARRALEKYGYTPVLAEDGYVALELLSAAPVGLTSSCSISRCPA
jgi:two-component system, cell cycle sensor histidine kinase and response regulator CckA